MTAIRRSMCIATLAAAALAAVPVVLAGDWRGDVAKKAIGAAVREGLEEAAKDAALGLALDAASEAAANAAADAAANFAESTYRPIDDYIEISETVGDGFDAAMRVAEVGERLDDVADAAKAVKRISKIRKLKR